MGTSNSTGDQARPLGSVPSFDELIPGSGPLTSHRRTEVAVAAALVAASAPVAVATGAPLAAWSPSLVAVLVGAAALRRQGPPSAVLARAGALLAASVLALWLDPTMLPVTLLTAVLVTATYPAILPTRLRPVAGAAALASLGLPLLGVAVRSLLPLAHRDLLGDASSTPLTTTLCLVGGVAVVAAVASLTAASQTGRHGARPAGGPALERTPRVRTASAPADEDPVTGLLTREALLRQADTAFDRVPVLGGQVGLLVLELARFPELLDGYGSGAAEQVLRQVARRLRAARPAVDVVARIGDHRFAILVEGVGPAGLDGVARRVAALLDETVVTEDVRLSVTCAIGAALSTTGVPDGASLLHAAEQALHLAVKDGRATWITFDQAMRAHAREQADLEIELREALARGEIRLVYQPLVTLGPGVDIALDADHELALADPLEVEALARWTRRDGSPVTPARFLALAEDLGLGVWLGHQVLDQALTALAQWRARGVPITRVWVNVSGAQLADPEFARTLSARMAAHTLSPDQLGVDVHCSDLVESEQVDSTLRQLHSLGVQLAVDDFGAAGTALSALRRWPLNMIKADRRITQEAGPEDAVAGAVITLAHGLGMRVLFEGVETREQLHAVRVLGADAAQGFLLGGPVDADAVTGSRAAAVLS